MRAHIVAFAFVAAPAMAADFRGSDFGSPCNLIPQREQVLGSKETGDASSSNANAHRFAGLAFDRDAVITYLCKDGSLALADLHFPRKSYGDAVADFHAVYAMLISTYGAPVIEYSADRGGSDGKQLPMEGAAPKTYLASWRAPRFRATLNLTVLGERDGPNWQAFVVVAP
jgi:hypothetical protein